MRGLWLRKRVGVVEEKGGESILATQCILDRPDHLRVVGGNRDTGTLLIHRRTFFEALVGRRLSPRARLLPFK